MQHGLRLGETWLEAVGDEFAKPHMLALREFIGEEVASGATVRPPPPLFFAALDRTPLPSVRAVIIGQDPYFNPGQAHGLSFSVPRDVAIPSSLRNIHVELVADLGIPRPGHGSLEAWADRGVLMLNSILSVRQGAKASHAGRGWEQFTDRVVKAVNDRPGRVAFVLWGAYAQKKATAVDRSRHLVVASAHPSGLSAYRGFFGSRPFSKVNAFLEANGGRPIDWNPA